MNKQEQTMEERFDEFWYNSEKNDDYGVLARLKDGDDPDYLIKDFIKNEIALAVQQRDKEITEKARKLFEDENPVDCIDGETPVETYGYEATFNNGIKAVIEVIKKNL